MLERRCVVPRRLCLLRFLGTVYVLLCVPPPLFVGLLAVAITSSPPACASPVGLTRCVCVAPDVPSSPADDWASGFDAFGEPTAAAPISAAVAQPSHDIAQSVALPAADWGADFDDAFADDAFSGAAQQAPSIPHAAAVAAPASTDWAADFDDAFDTPASV